MASDDRKIATARLTWVLLAVFGVGYCYWNLGLLYALFCILHGNDFCRMYFTAAAYWQGADMYGWNVATPARLVDSTTIDLWNMNPPHFHLILLPFALIPWQAGLAAWILVGFLVLFVSLRLIVREIHLPLTPRGGLLGLVAVLGFSGTTTVVSTGQLTFLMLLPVTLAWREARRGDWVRSGLYLGMCMSIKPFLLIFLAYFLLQRRWAATAAAIGAAAACFAVGLLVFGVRNHLMWIEGLGDVEGWAWLPMNASLEGALLRSFRQNAMFTPLAVLSLDHLRLAWLAIGGLIGIATLVAVRDATTAGVDRAFALLLIASILLCPLGWVYYFWLPAGPMMALMTAASRRRLEPEPRRIPDGSRDSRWDLSLLWLGLPGLFLQVHTTISFQPSALATLIVGNVYFWTILGIWGGLVILPSGRPAVCSIRERLRMLVSSRPVYPATLHAPRDAFENA
jgi:hypothetical protein